MVRPGLAAITGRKMFQPEGVSLTHPGGVMRAERVDSEGGVSNQRGAAGDQFGLAKVK